MTAPAVAVPATAPRGRRRVARAIFWTLLLGGPWLLGAIGQTGIVVSANLASVAVLAALSIVILTGWIGQISLCQAAFLGMGAYTAGQVQNHWGITFPWHLAIAGAVGGLTALVIGIPALRLKGLYLAVATLAFQWAMENSFFKFTWFAGGLDGVRIRAPIWGPRSDYFEFDLDDQRIFFYFAWAIVLGLTVLAANLRDSKIGRAWFAIRGSETAARTLGINVTRYKLIGFVFSGFYAGVAGGILINWISLVTFEQFLFNQSLTYLSTAVLGGIVHLIGSFIAGLAFAVIRFFLDRFPEAGGFLPIIVGLIVIVTILQNPGGLAHSFQELAHKLKERRASHHAGALRLRIRALVAGLTRREPHGATIGSEGEHSGLLAVSGASAARALESGDELFVGESRSAEELVTASALFKGGEFGNRDLPSEPRSESRGSAESLLDIKNVSVAFGGVIANDDIKLEVRRGEIVGLIGPNGAGKTTLFNVISGLVRADRGSVVMLGSDISGMPVHQRAGAGLGRTFQLIRLFPRLTVFENLMVATHLSNQSGFWSNLFVGSKARDGESKSRERVREVIDLLGLNQVSDQLIAGLPFGILRMVELARALVSEPKILLLDEPASGLDAGETDQLARMLLYIRDRFDLSILLIEHDMRLVMLVSDYVYVLDFGRLLAEGPPAEIQTHPGVISAYLGDQEEQVAVG